MAVSASEREHVSASTSTTMQQRTYVHTLVRVVARASALASVVLPLSLVRLALVGHHNANTHSHALLARPAERVAVGLCELTAAIVTPVLELALEHIPVATLQPAVAMEAAINPLASVALAIGVRHHAQAVAKSVAPLAKVVAAVTARVATIAVSQAMVP